MSRLSSIARIPGFEARSPCAPLWAPACRMVALAVLVWLSAGCVPAGAAEPHHRFVDPGDGTIVDQATGLRWQKCSYGQTYADGLCTGTASRIRWHDALRRCRQAAAGSGENGFSPTRRSGPEGLPPGDWRLPLQADLESLLIYRPGGERPFIDLDFFPSSYPLRYWSGTARIDDRGTSGVVVNFLEGTVYTERAGIGDSDGKNYVRCVDVGRRTAASNSSFIDRR